MIIGNTGKKSQNLIEVILIIPLLLIILFGIIEYSVFQKTVSTVQDIAEDAAIAASKYYVDPTSGPFAGVYTTTENPAVNAALNKVRIRTHVLGLNFNNYAYNDLGSAFGKRPFALYEFDATDTITYKGNSVPILIFTVDYRDPMYEGVSTQLIYYYHLMLMGLKLGVPGREITIIPDIIQISSIQTREYVNY